MKYILIVVALAPMFAFAQETSKGKNLVSEEAAVLKTIRAWNNAFAANDPETYFKFVHDDLTLFVPSSPYRIDGKADDREEFEYSLKKGWTRVGYFQELQVKTQIIGNTAIVTYHNRATYGEGVGEKMLCLKETDVLVKENGQWKVIHIHVSNSN